MAITDAYATAAQYRAGVDQDDTGEDTEIGEYLAAVSRMLERRMGLMVSGLPRHFTIAASATAKLFNGDGSTRFWIDDIGSLTGLVVAVDLNADQVTEKTLTEGTDFYVGNVNSQLGAELTPYRWLEIIPTTAALSAWPSGQRSMRVTALWGWPAIPVPIEKATIAITKQVRDATKQPFTLTLESLEAQIQMSPGASKIINELSRYYTKGNVAL